MNSQKAFAIAGSVLFALLICGCDSNGNNRPNGVFTPADVEGGEARVQDGAQMGGGMPGGMGGGPSGKGGSKSGKSKESKGAKGKNGKRGNGKGGFGGFGGGGGFNFDPESIFKDRDKNEDGKITEDEIDPDAPAWMNPMRFDADKDGGVSKEEFEKGIAETMKQFREGGFGGSRGGRGGPGGFGGKNRPQSKDRPAADEDDSKAEEKSTAESSKEG